MEEYRQYMQEQQAAAAAAANAPRAVTPEAEAGGGALMFGNSESTVERKARIKGELRRMNGYNSQVVAQQQRESPTRGGAASPAAGARLPALPPQPQPQPQRQPQRQPQPQPQPQPLQRRPPPQGEAPGQAPSAAAPVGGGGGGGGADAAADDARFRSLERQCIELREEQRQILGWLAKSEEKAAAESEARERAESSLRGLLEQTVKAQEVLSEQMGARIQRTHSELSVRVPRFASTVGAAP